MHLLAAGETGGIETLCRDYAMYSKHKNTFVFIWGYNGKTYIEMKKNGADVFQLNASKKKPMKIIKKLEKIRKQREIEVVIVHHAAPLMYLYLSFVKKIQKNNIKTILYAHGNAVDMYHIHEKGWQIRKLILQFTIKRVDQIIAISESVGNSLINCVQKSEHKITIIYNGVELNRFENTQLHSFSNPVRFIYVGRLIKEKGVQITLQALSKLSDDFSWTFWIVGDGPYRSELEKISKKYCLAEKVQFLGTRNDVPKLLHSADIFIHSPIWEEGFGIAIVEAMAAGLVCICTKSGAIPEIITDGKDGFLVDMTSIEQLKDTLKLVCALSDDERERIQTNSKKRSRSFSFDIFAKRLDITITVNDWQIRSEGNFIKNKNIAIINDKN